MAKFVLRVIFGMVAFVGSFYPTSADTIYHTVRIIIAMDQSRSMFDNKAIHNIVSGEGLLVFFSNYQVTTCAEVTVDYVGWGNSATDPIPVAFKARESGGQFAVLVSAINQQVLDATAPTVALMTARARLAASGADEQVIVFVTDGLPSDENMRDVVISGLVPSQIHLAGITFGTKTVETYVQEKILRPGDLGFHVKTADDFELALAQILKSLPILNTPCAG